MERQRTEEKGLWFVVSEQMLRIYGEHCAKADDKNFDGICDGCGFFTPALANTLPSVCRFDIPAITEKYIRSFPIPPARKPDPCENCREACIMACAMCVDRPFKLQTSRQYTEEREGALAEFEKRLEHRFRPHTLQGFACRNMIKSIISDLIDEGYQ